MKVYLGSEGFTGLQGQQEFRKSINPTTPEQCSNINRTDTKNDGQLGRFRVAVYYLSGALRKS